jgi:HAE1 family hydrophobic/amphiphilic exporter-1
MTTLTTILALLPLALGIGEGADAQAPLARAVIGGLTASTLVTLVLIPVVYTMFYGTRTTRTA